MPSQRPQKQIVAMGGGGFSMEPDNLLLDRYLLSRCAAPDPLVALLPTASGDSDYLVARFYQTFNTLPCRTKHLSLFRHPADLEKEVMECDALYVTGGNTRNMLAIWRSCGMDTLLRQAWEQGTLLCGLSAGAICWFEQGHTDSWGPLASLDCLGLLPGSCCPHYDGESQRRPSYHQHLREGKMQPGLALDDGAAAHFIDRELKEIVTSRPRASAFQVAARNGTVEETRLSTRYLGDRR